MPECTIRTQPANAGRMATSIRVLPLLQRRQRTLLFLTSTKLEILTVRPRQWTGAFLRAQQGLTVTMLANGEVSMEHAIH